MTKFTHFVELGTKLDKSFEEGLISIFTEVKGQKTYLTLRNIKNISEKYTNISKIDIYI